MLIWNDPQELLPRKHKAFSRILERSETVLLCHVNGHMESAYYHYTDEVWYTRAFVHNGIGSDWQVCAPLYGVRWAYVNTPVITQARIDE